MDLQSNIATAETKLCAVCQQFYGNIHTDFLCSKCYKNKKGETSVSKPIITKDVKADELFEEKQQVMENDVINQTDCSKCWNCQRKVGFLGYKCKCNYTFCKFHRLPEEHNCNFDFKTIGKDKLKEANPLVKASKIDKI